MNNNDQLMTIRIRDEDTIDKLYKIIEQESINRNQIVNDILENFFKDYIIKKDGTIEYIGTNK